MLRTNYIRNGTILRYIVSVTHIQIWMLSMLRLARLREPHVKGGMAMGTDIFEKIDVHLQNHHIGTWTGTFRDYLSMVMKQPSLAQRAHARLYNMIKHVGVQVDDEGKEHYAFFEQDLFGIDEPLARVVEH